VGAAGTQYYYQLDTPQGDQVSVTIRLGVSLSLRRLPGAPSLLRLTWCAPTNYYLLEWTDRLRSPPQTIVWSTNLASLLVGNGIQVNRFLHTADVAVNSPARFFRLRKRP
jgi:hypothetical protein